MNKKVKSIPNLSLKLTESRFDLHDPIVPRLPSEYISCDDENHPLKDIASKYEDTHFSLGKGSFKSALLVKNITTGGYFVAFDFVYPTSRDSIKEICNFIKIFYKKIEKNSHQCLKNVLCPVDIGFVTKNDIKHVRFVTDYFRGVNLETWLENNKCTEGHDGLKLNVMIKLIDALNDLHSKWNYIHHDIKPANIMINAIDEKDPEVAIIDIFGGCFENDSDCNPMSDEKYKFIIGENGSMTVDPDIYAMSKVFKDIIGGKWTGDTSSSFECNKEMSEFETSIYELSEKMANGEIMLSEVKEILHKMRL